MKVSELLVKAPMVRVPKAHNLAEVSWVDGYMLVRFQFRGQLYCFGPDIPKEEYDKIMRVPFPDKIFVSAIKNKYKVYKVPSAS